MANNQPQKLFTSHVSVGSIATGSSQKQVRPCPIWRRKRKSIQGISDAATGHCGLYDRPAANYLASLSSHQSAFGYALVSPHPGLRCNKPLITGRVAV